MSESQSKSVIDSVAENLTKYDLAEMLINMTDDMRYEASTSGDAEESIVLMGNADEIKENLLKLFKVWNKESDYNTSLVSVKDVYGIENAKRYTINIEMKRRPRDWFSNPFDEEDESAFCKVIDEADLPKPPPAPRRVLTEEDKMKMALGRKKASEDRKKKAVE